MSNSATRQRDFCITMFPDNLRLFPACTDGSLDRDAFPDVLKRAIREGYLDVHYQPQIDLQTRTFCHLEALVRWHDPTLGHIAPAIFVPLAEELGLMDEVTCFVIKRVMSDLSHWQMGNLPIKSVGINVSARHFSDEPSAERLLQWLSSETVPAEMVTLELTETAVLSNTGLTARTLQELQTRGFRIALDDFGTGYSSLDYLREFPIDQIKLDRSFVSALTHSDKTRTIVRALLALAQSLELETIAEGVENAEQLSLLSSWGCTRAQGFYLSKPIPKHEAADFAVHCSHTEVRKTA